MTPDNFPVGCFFKNNFDVIEGYKPCSKRFLMAFTYDFEQVKRVQNE